MSEVPSVDLILPDLRSCGDDPERTIASRVRQYLEQTREYLAHVHAQERSGLKVIHLNSDLTDRLVRRLFALAEESLLADGGQLESGLCVVAVGGYARREMSIHSDVDLLVVYSGELTPYVAAISERLQYWMWDAGLTVGCATRTPEDTVVIGKQDNTVRTAVLVGRFLCGDGEFFHRFNDTIRKQLLPDVEDFIELQFDTLEQRHSQYGESAFLLQPNVKEGVGGLRDYHAALWVARAVEPTSRDYEDFLHLALLTDSEMQEYRSALDFIWRVRNALHLRAGRCADQMSFELQEQIAESLGYGAIGDGGPELSVETFMREYYRHVRNIENYSDLVMEQCRARATKGGVRREVEEVEEGFRLSGGHIEIPHVQHLRERPVRLLQIFAVAQKYSVPLSRMARRMVRQNLDLVDDAFRTDPECHQAFAEILGGENRVMRSLVTMNEEGLMAAFIPEWEHIVCRWQHVIYHTYTVDIHSIFLVEELRRLEKGKYEKAVPNLTEMMQEVVDLEVLYLGCLLHDIGKGLGGDHSNRGVPRARAVVERLGISEERADRVVFLVKYHLLMSHLAQRRDLSDARLIVEFARICGDRKNLRNLYLLTFADIRASSQDAWTDWKGQLIAELFERTAEFLEIGADSKDKAMELIEARVEVRQRGAREELRNLGIADAKIRGFFESMPRRYFISHTPRQIARHGKVVMRYESGVEIATGMREMRGDFTEFILCTRDVHGLYSKVAGTFTARHFDILGSHVYSSRSGFALEVYRISTPAGGRAEREMAWREFEEALQSVIAGATNVEDLLSRRGAFRKRLQLPSRNPSSVLLSNEESDFYTIADVTTDDRAGLLYDLTNTIAHHGLNIYISKAATIQDQVTDTFYLKDRDGKKLKAEAIRALHVDLLEAVQRADDVAGGHGVGRGR